MSAMVAVEGLFMAYFSCGNSLLARHVQPGTGLPGAFLVLAPHRRWHSERRGPSVADGEGL